MVGQDAQRMKITQLRSRANNAVVGSKRSGMFCGSDGEQRFDNTIGQAFALFAAQALRKEMEAAGYPQPPSSAFEQQTADATIEYQIGLTVTDVQLELCRRPPQLTGGAWMKIDLELYAPRERRVVFKGSYEGHRQTAPDRYENAVSFHEELGRAVARNVLADPRFVEQATRRAQPEAAAASAAPEQTLALLRRPAAAAASTAQQMPQLQSAVATVFSGAGSGSAFLVDAGGHWLTSRHVVGDAKFVKLKLANGRELLGEVLRGDSKRDVALVKSEPVALQALAVAEEEPAVGSEVFAIGSPLGERLEGTVTRGVVSSLREVEGRRFVQSDVKVLPGSSGGPLLDGRGAVLGLTAGGIGGVATGMNLFVPIREALATLRLDYAPPPPR